MKRLFIAFAALLALALPARAATQLFTTDFSGASMGACNIGSGQISGSWPINGAGFPIVVNGGGSTGFQVLANSTITCNNSTTPPEVDLNGSKLWVDEIVTSTRHDGTTGPMWHQLRAQNFDGLMQDPYVVSPGSDVLDLYIMAYIKFPADFIGTNNWRALFEWKDSCENASCSKNGYRIAVYIQSDSSGNIFWDMHGDNNPPGPWFWDLTSNTAIPVNQWVKVEWAWHRTHDNTSWAKFWMNGTLLMDQEGQGGCGGCSAVDGFYVTGSDTDAAAINRIMIGQMYGPTPTPQEQWIDHIEVWNGVPTAPPPPAVTSSSYNIASGAAFTGSWVSIAAGCNNSGATTDWVGFYPAGAPLSQQVANFAPSPCGATSGSHAMTAVDNTGALAAAGNYNLRYYSGASPCCALVAQSNTIVVTVPPPATPSGVAISCPSTPAISWTAVSGATSYDVYRNGTKIGSPTSTTFTDNNATASTSDTYTVDAANSAGTSAQSSGVTVRTCGP